MAKLTERQIKLRLSKKAKEMAKKLNRVVYMYEVEDLWKKGKIRI